MFQVNIAEVLINYQADTETYLLSRSRVAHSSVLR